MDKDIFKGIKFGFGFFLFFSLICVAFFGVVYAVGFHSADEILDGTFMGNYNFVGDVNITGNINFSNANIDGLNLNEKNPSGAIMAFYLTSCPTGWIAADGSLGTPDLRGQFIRGINNFGTGDRVDGNQDPDTRSIGSFQIDEFKSHIHGDNGAKLMYEGGGGYGATQLGGDKRLAIPRGGAETRPKNIGLIYCMKY